MGSASRVRAYLCLKRFVRSDTSNSCQQVDSIWDAAELDYLVWLDKVRFLEAGSCETNLVQDKRKFRRVFRRGSNENVEIAGVTRPAVKSEAMSAHNHVFNAVGV